MASSLDMSLDELIKKNKKPSSDKPPRGGGGRAYSGGGGGGGPGPARRLPGRYENRVGPYTPVTYPPFEKAPDSMWYHDRYYNQFGIGAAGHSIGPSSTNSIEIGGTVLHISNLDYGVLNEDIKELFGEIGELKSYSINYDRSGRSKGTAEVVFAKHADAIAAVKRYNNVHLDGKEMKIEIIASNNININNNIQAPLLPLPPPPPFQFPNTSFGGNFNPNAPSRRSRQGFSKEKTGGKNDRDRANQVKKKVSVTDLDAELDKYMHSK
ncbi:hypothetical protein LUZ60_015309 [Juncus effusus]|nr:hypothetical protein LUZ60_015309 [Juncus effusus]